MKHFLTLRLRLATVFFVLASLFFVVSLSDLLAGNGRSTVLKSKPAPNAAPGSGQLNPAGGTQPWAGAAAGPVSISLDESTCVDGQNCDTYLLTLNGNASDWVGKKARVTISWPANGDDFDVFIHKTNNSGALVGSAAASGAGPEVVELDPSVVGVGAFSVHVVYFSAVLGDSYSGLAEVVTTGGPTPTPTASPSPGMTPTPTPGIPGQARFHTFNSPQGYGDDSGEPSIGVNWLSEKSFTNNNIVTGAVNPAIPNGGTSLYYGGFLSYMLKVTFDDCSSPAHALWEQKPVTLPAAPRVFGDPILFTDHETGRTFVAQELGLSPGGSTTEFTDNDGDSFSPSEGSGLPSCVDHETFGGGPFHAPIPSNLVYPHGIWYASQCIADATASLSLDGGMTFQTEVPMYTVAQCSGLHGHLKVGPDGTAYVPNKGCGGPLTDQPAVVVSENNGVSWNVRPIPGAATIGDDDPSVGVATDSNTIFLGYQSSDGHPRIAVSHDKGVNWSTPVDVGASVGVVNCTYPAVVAGDGEQAGPNKSRAAFAFYGTTTAGGYDQPEFPGVWYLYIATTFDGGQTWTTVNATPDDPVQRGGICGDGTCRNLLDFFDATIDKEGRIVVGWDDGCIGGCVNGGNNSFTAKAVVTRQSGGKRMFAANDPAEPLVPGAPAVNGVINGSTVQLTWTAPDNGGSAITSYKVYRGSGASFTLIATVTVPSFTDPNYTSGNAYRVTAVNAIGESPYCHDFAPSSGPVATSCVLPGILTNNDFTAAGADNDSGQNTPIDPRVNARQLYVAEPYVSPSDNRLFFTLKVGESTAGGAPPNSQWYIIWNRQGADAGDPNDASFDRLYVAMKTDASGNPTFEYGKFGIPINTSPPPLPDPNSNTPVKYGNADASSYNPLTGTILLTIDKAKLRAIDGGATKYQPGSDLPALNVRTYFNRPDPGQRSQNNASDITDDSSYTIVGNQSCALPVVPIKAVSTKTHGPAGVFDIDLPLTGTPGIECRIPGANNSYQVVVTFAAPVTVTSATADGATVNGSPVINGNEVTINLNNVANAQTIMIHLLGVNDGSNTSDVTIPMSVLLGDTTANGQVNSSDVTETKSDSGKATTSTNFRRDVNVNGLINSSDVSLVKSKSGTALPAAADSARSSGKN